MSRREWFLPLTLLAVGSGGLLYYFRRDVVRAVNFDPTDVLPDKSMFGYQPIDVQKFFEDKNSFLANHTIPTDTGPVAASSWIARQARENDVNPAWILTRLQAEQGLISTSPTRAVAYAMTPKSWTEFGPDNKPYPMTHFDAGLATKLDYMLRWALGYSAFESGFKPSLAGRPMAGIGNQIKEMAAWTHRQGVNTESHIPLTDVDGAPLQAKTRATYAMYRYTPHVAAAKETQAIYEGFFPAFTYAA